MEQHTEQINRIKKKLVAASKADKKRQVFGAGSHQYVLHEPATENEVAGFEKEFSVQLPACYRAFLLQLGNGGNAYMDSAAGPFYGIYPLGENVDELLHTHPEKYLRHTPSIYPGLTTEEWQALSEKKFNDDSLSDEMQEAETGKVFGGILPIGSQGCSYLHGLVLAGEHKGRVVNLDMDGQPPKFTFENNFLDWYERWLDEVISGELITDEATWFGYNMGGTDAVLFEKYVQAKNAYERESALNGLLCKKNIDNALLHKIEAEIPKANKAEQKLLIQLLAISAFEKAAPYLARFTGPDLVYTFKFVDWYAPQESEKWIPFIEKNIGEIQDEDTFNACTGILEKCTPGRMDLVAGFTKHANARIRESAIYTLGQSPEKSQYMDQIIAALSDETLPVVRIALQALEGVKDKTLLPHYKKIIDRYPKEQGYILSNVDNRLKEHKLTVEKLRTMSDTEIENWKK